jgi:hypothetical protein
VLPEASLPPVRGLICGPDGEGTDPESPVVKIFARFINGITAIFEGIDFIELIVVVCLGTAFFAAASWTTAKKVLESGSILYLSLFRIFVVASLGSIIRDCIYRSLGKISKFFLACWGICALVAGWL